MRQKRWKFGLTVYLITRHFTKLGESNRRADTREHSTCTYLFAILAGAGVVWQRLGRLSDTWPNEPSDVMWCEVLPWFGGFPRAVAGIPDGPRAGLPKKNLLLVNYLKLEVNSPLPHGTINYFLYRLWPDFTNNLPLNVRSNKEIRRLHFTRGETIQRPGY